MSTGSSKNKLLLRPTGLFRVLDKSSSPASTALTAKASKGDATFAVTSATGVTAGKTFRIGDGENIERVTVSSVASLVVTTTRPIMRDHVLGENVVECTVYDLGRIGSAASLTVDDGGLDFETEDRRQIYARVTGIQDNELAASLVGLTPYTLAVALGIPFANVVGSGTHTAPYAVQTDGTEVGTQINQSIIVQAVTMDGSPVTVEIWGCDNDYTGVSLPMARGAGLIVPCKWTGAMSCIDYNAVAITADTSLTSARGDLLASITDIGIFEAATTGALATMLSAPASAAQNTVAATSTTNLAADDFVQLNTDINMEVHRVNNPATTTLVTPLYRAQPTGTALVRLKQTSLGGVVKGSAKLSMSGSVDKIQLENQPATIGLKPGAATPSLEFGVADFVAAVTARMLAIPQSEAAGGRFTTENVGTSPIAAMYLQGKNVTGSTVLIVLTGCTQAIQAVALELAKKGITGQPFNVRPGSVLQLTVYS